MEKTVEPIVSPNVTVLVVVVHGLAGAERPANQPEGPLDAGGLFGPVLSRARGTWMPPF